ncbi:MAG: radical SAM protein [Candidatus Aminicenantales bacterium]
MLALQEDIIYGPVNSRRLGPSLGINLLPPGQKVCPFNCVYCQYGWSEIYQSGSLLPASFPTVEEVRRALIKALKSLNELPGYITFSGNGEPTLHPDFGHIVKEVINIRNELSPRSRTAVLSNSALVSKKR